MNLTPSAQGGQKTDASVAALLAGQAAAAPDNPAIAAPGRRSLGYGRLYEHVCSVVSALRVSGIGPNDRIAVVLPNGPEMATAFVACSAAAACAPLNPGYSRTEFDFYLRDLRATAVLVLENSQSPVVAVAQEQRLPLLTLAPCWEAEAGLFKLTRPGLAWPSQPAIAATNQFTAANDTALLLHTSGTTSQPKLVPLSHANLCASAASIRGTLELQPLDRCLNVMPLFHIHGLIAGLLASLAGGGTVVCTPGFDASRFHEWLRECRPTWYTAVPTIHQAIVGLAAEQRGAFAGVGLRFIRSSSAALPPRTMQDLESIFQAPVVESYGMTEASHQMCSNPLPPAGRKPGSVGLPAGPEVAVVDAAGDVLPPGSIGEVVIRGPGVTAGYENNPAANETAFLRGWFRTGDQGRLDAEGYLFLTGRLKELINRGGEKISPREVDEALLEHPAVARAVAFAVPHARLGEDLAAAVVLKPDATATPRQLREFALSSLAQHKVPSQIIVLDEIPKGPTGKLQRIGLHEKLADKLRAPFFAPRDPGERTLAGMWSSVLGGVKVGIHDNFFALGGDSLLAATVAMRVRAAFGLQIDVTTIFREPTVAALATYLECEVSRLENEEQEASLRLLAELEGLSDAEAERLLAEAERPTEV
jgi:acyl-CoA synthetase (AMP-forming)/AMP-acid ligase II